MFQKYISQYRQSKNILINNREAVSVMKFPDGAINVKVHSPYNSEDLDLLNPRLTITAKILSSDDLIALLLTIDVLRSQYFEKDIDLIIPYFPYSRQDRIVNSGESFSLKAIANMINSMNFDSILVYDPHSNVIPALLNNCQVIEQYELVNEMVHDYNYKCDYIISPDVGAEKKAAKVANELNLPLIRMYKQRNPVNGKIEKTTLIDNIPSGTGLIVDDICDGGSTFIEAAKVIEKSRFQETGPLDLFVTHGLFSKGVEVFMHTFNNVFYSNSLYDLKSLDKINKITFA